MKFNCKTISKMFDIILLTSGQKHTFKAVLETVRTKPLFQQDDVSKILRCRILYFFVDGTGATVGTAVTSILVTVYIRV